MSLLTTSDVIANAIKLGAWDYKITNDQYEPNDYIEISADLADASLGIASALSDNKYLGLSSVGAGFGSLYSWIQPITAAPLIYSAPEYSPQNTSAGVR